MKKTKIICSIGPASYDKDVMREMIKSGMNVARCNFSHATPEEKKMVEEDVRYFNEEEGCNIGLLFDTKGPDLRTTDFEGDYITLNAGDEILISKENKLGTEKEIGFNHPEVIDNINEGDNILIDDGLLRLVVEKKDSKGLTCKILAGGTIKSRRGVNVPGVNLGMPFINEADRIDIKYACEHKGDFLAASFVSTPQDVKDLRKLLKEFGRPEMKIISKIETQTGIENIDEIIDLSDGIMVARGDLGVEVPMEKLPTYQKMIIKKCREKCKICVVATEMLASMYTAARPTRAEVSDIANAVLDGCDAIMLSGETTMGAYPIEAVKYMSRIASEAENQYDYSHKFNYDDENDVTEAIGRAVIDASNSLNAKAIVAATISGYTASRISNLKPKSVIVAPCVSKDVAHGLALNYGVYPVLDKKFDTMDEVIDSAVDSTKNMLGLTKGDILVITGGFPSIKNVKTTNFMKVEVIDK